MHFEGSVLRLDPDKRGVWIKISPPDNGRHIARARLGLDGTRGLLTIIDSLKPNTSVTGFVEFKEGAEFGAVSSVNIKEDRT